MRTGGGDGLAFGIACLAGPNAALPHGSPSAREVHLGQVLLFDFGAMVGQPLDPANATGAGDRGWLILVERVGAGLGGREHFLGD